MYDWKLELAKKCGADLVFNPSQCQLQDEIDKLTDGYGCDVYFEATGHPASVPQGNTSKNCIGKRAAEKGEFFYRFGSFDSTGSICLLLRFPKGRNGRLESNW